MFYILKKKIMFWVKLNLSSENTISLNKSKILLFDEELRATDTHAIIIIEA